MGITTPRRTERHRRTRRRRGIAAPAAVTAAVAGSLAVAVPALSAPVYDFVIDALPARLAPDAPDASPGDGVCATAAGTCTLRAALQESNALNATGVSIPSITVAPGLSGDINPPTSNNATNWMRTSKVMCYDYGACYEITAPVTLDLDNRVAIWSTAEPVEAAALHVDAKDVTLRNMSKILASGTSIVMGPNADGVIVEGGSTTTSENYYPERFIAYREGAKNITVRDYAVNGFRTQRTDQRRARDIHRRRHHLPEPPDGHVDPVRRRRRRPVRQDVRDQGVEHGAPAHGRAGVRSRSGRRRHRPRADAVDHEPGDPRRETGPAPVTVTLPDQDVPAETPTVVTLTVASADTNYDGLVLPDVTPHLFAIDPATHIKKDAYIGMDDRGSVEGILATGTSVTSGSRVIDGMDVCFVYTATNRSADDWATALREITVINSDRRLGPDQDGVIGRIDLLPIGASTQLFGCTTLIASDTTVGGDAYAGSTR